MRPIRKAKIGAFLRNEIARLVQTEIRDPRIGFVSITRVEPTEDLAEAKVFVSVLGTDAEKRTSLRGLEAARAYIQGQLKGLHQWRRTPVLRFELDESIEKQLEMDRIIEQARAESAEGAASVDGAEFESDDARPDPDESRDDE